MARPVVAVLDATPCIELHRLGIEQVLTQPFDHVYLPTTVFGELLAGSHLDQAYEIVHLPKVRLRKPGAVPLPLAAEALDKGERGALRVAREVDADRVVIDDKRGRKVARSMGFRVIGTVGLIARAAREGLLESVHPYFLQLRNTNFRATDRLFNEILDQLGEPPLPPSGT